jgi:prolyl oligopeptidase
MRRIIALVCSAAAFTPLAAASTPPKHPPLPPAKPVTETIFGQKVTDPYRYFEQQGPAVTRWMKAEGRYTRAVLDAVPEHDRVLPGLSEMTGSWVVASDLNRIGNRIFYEQRGAGSDNYDLMVRDEAGRIRKIVDIAAIRAANGGEPFAINYFQPSNDGTKVAVGISKGGSEDASLWIYDAPTGARVAGPVPNAQFGAVSWAPDDQSLFVNLLTPMKTGQAETDKYKFSKDYVWNFKSAPVAVLGAGVSPAVSFKPEEFPFIATIAGSPLALAVSINGVQNEWAAWTAPVADASRPNAPWRKLVGREDGVTNVAVAGNRIFLLSHKDAPTFQVLALDAGQPISAAQVLIPGRPDRVIEGIGAAADGLYVRTRRGVYSELVKVPLQGGPEQAVALPFKGSISELSTDPRVPGAVVVEDSWAVPRRAFAYDPGRGFADLALGNGPKGFDPSRYAALDLQAKAADGVEVPLSVVTAKDAKHPRPLLLWAYGSYGISQFPGFGTRTMATLPYGIDYAVCHVRGGGELGEAWRLAGKDANKPNTWRDLIACGETLIAGGYTTKSQLFIGGGSAGGITMGRAMEERPDLFAGVFDLVPAANALRSEFSPNGPPNIPEFGTIKTQAGFRNLLAMDSVQHVQRGVTYPPVMITTGLNDPRVSSWEPAKFAASLRAAGAPGPVLLRIDEKAGHGIGSTKSQTDALYADVTTFILWRTRAAAEASRPRPERGR